MKTINTEFCNILLFDVEEALPPNKSWVSVIIKDFISCKITMRGAYYEGGTFWDTAGSHAESVVNQTGKPGIEVDFKNPDFDDFQIYEEVIAWMKPAKE